MKKNFTIVFVLFVFIGLHPASAQTPITHTGDISVTTQAQVDALRTSLTAGVTRIKGNVTIGPKSGTSDISDLSPFASITEITGNVTVQRNPDLPNLMGLNQLQSIGGHFGVDKNDSLTSLGDFPALQSIGGDFGGFSNDALTSLGGFPALQSIGGSFEVYYNIALTSLGDFPVLQSIGGDFGGFSNDALTSLGGFPALQSIGGNVEVKENEALGSLGNFPALQSIGGSFWVYYNDALTSLGNFSTLQSIGGHFEVSYNDVLTSLGGFPMLASIGSNQDGVSIYVEGNELLQDCCVLTAFLRDAKNAVSGKVIINDNEPECSSTTEVNCGPFLQVGQKVVFAAKTTAEGRLDLFSTLRWQLSKPNTGAEWITSIAAGGGNSDASSITGKNHAFITITTVANPNDAGRSTTLTLRAIDQTGNALTDPMPITIPFIQLGITTGSITLESQADVNAFPANVTAIQGHLNIGNSDNDITDLRPLSGITHVTGSVEVWNNSRLVSLDPLGNLQFIGSHFSVGGNNSLPSLGDFPALQSIGGDFYMRNNSTLTSLGDFSTLQSIGGDFEMDENNVLTSLGDFSTLQSISGGFVVGGGYPASNASLISLGDFPALQTIGGSFGVKSNSALTSLGNFPTLQSIGNSFWVNYNAALTSLGDFSTLQSIGGDFEMKNNSTLTSLGNFTTLQTIGGSFGVINNDALTSLGGFPMLASIGSPDRIYVPSTDSRRDGVSIVVEGNDRLQDCCVLTAFLSGATNAVSGKVFINKNASGCSSEAEVNCDPFLQVGQKVVFVAKTATTEGTLEIFSTLHWQLSKPNTGAEWITNIAVAGGSNSDASSITGENDAFITITTTANPSNAGRSTTLTLTAIDQAGNALTDPASITIPFTQWGITHTGDVFVTTQAEVDALRTSLTAGATRIVGNVTIGPESGTSDITDLSPFAAIIEVTGNVRVQGNPDLTNLMGLNQLQTIGGRFVVYRNRTLTSLGDFPALQSIGEFFVVSSNAVLTSLGDFTVLQSVGGNFSVSGNAALTSLGDFPALQSIGYFYVRSNAALTSLGDFPALQSVGGNFSVSGNAALTSLGDFPALQSIGYFYVRSNAALISLGGFPMLASIGSADRTYVQSTDSNQDDVSIVVERNNLLQDCCVLTAFLNGATNAVSGKVFINKNASGCSSEAEVNCDPFLQVGQKVVFVAKTATTEGTLEIFSTLHWQLSKPNTGAEWITNIAVAGGSNSDASSITGENDAFITITTTANPSNAGRSTTLTLRAIDQTGNALTDLASVTISFTQLGITHTGDVSITTQAEADALRTSLTAGATRIVGNVTIGLESGASDITDLSPFAAIIEVTGNVRVQGNPDLTNLMGLNQLQTIGGRFVVYRNRTLTSLGDFPALQSIGGRFEVESNDAFTSLGDFTALKTIGGYFNVRNNDALTSLGNFTFLQSVGGNFSVSGNTTLTSLGDFPALQSIGYFYVRSNAALISLGEFPMLASIGSADRTYVQSTDSNQDDVSIVVERNNLLQDCCVLTAFLSGGTNAVSGKVFINKNATGCSSEAEIKPCAGGGTKRK